VIADMKYHGLQKKLETEREEMEQTKSEHRKMEAEWNAYVFDVQIYSSMIV